MRLWIQEFYTGILFEERVLDTILLCALSVAEWFIKGAWLR